MTRHPSDRVRRAFLSWIDVGLELQPEASRWPLETRGLRQAAGTRWSQYLSGQLWDSPEILPDAYCDRLEMPRRSTYGEAARTIWAKTTRIAGKA